MDYKEKHKSNEAELKVLTDTVVLMYPNVSDPQKLTLVSEVETKLKDDVIKKDIELQEIKIQAAKDVLDIIRT